MKKNYLILFLLSFAAYFAPAQYYTQYFEGADTIYDQSVNITIDTAGGNIWQIGRPQKILFDTAATAPNVLITDTILNYPINDTSVFDVRILNYFVPYGIFALQWKQKLDLDSLRDGGIVEFTTDQGLSWQNAFTSPYVYNFYGYLPGNRDSLPNGEYAFTGTDTSWRDIWLCFDLSWLSTFPDTISLRFTFVSDSVDNGKEGWMIDNFISHITFIHTVMDEAAERYLNVYPNPASDVVYVETIKLMEFHIIERMELTDPAGRVIDSWTNIPTKFWFDVQKYPPGHYFLKVKTNIKTEVVPLLIRKP